MSAANNKVRVLVVLSVLSTPTVVVVAASTFSRVTAVNRNSGSGELFEACRKKAS